MELSFTLRQRNIETASLTVSCTAVINECDKLEQVEETEYNDMMEELC